MKKQIGSINRTGRLSFLRLIAAALLLFFFLNGSAGAQAPWKFIAVGDTRGTSATDQINTRIVSELATEIVRQQAKFVLVPGDLVNSGSLDAFNSWKNLMAPVYNAGIEVLPIVGNHDANAISSWIQVFGPDIPDDGPSGELDRTYSYTYDNVLVLGLDNYVNAGRVNQAWVDSVLAANTRPHVFAFGHMPAFKANHTDCLDDYPTQRDAFWTSLKNAGARAYFAGHDHFYDHARIDDRDGNINNDVHQFIVGSGGAPFHTGYAYDGANGAWTPVNRYHEAQYYGYALVEIDGPNVTMTFYRRSAPNTYVATTDVWTYPPQPPVAVATAEPMSGQAPLTVHFDGSGSSADPEVAIMNYAWDFGDSGTGSGVSATHTYAAAGAYTATLTVTDSNGLLDSADVTVIVAEPPTVHIGDLDGTWSILKKSWTARVTILVHDAGCKAVSGAIVTGNWSEGVSGAGTCTTNRKGSCTVSKNSIPLGTSSVDFTVTGITKSGTSYLSLANHDDELDSNGTTITIRK